MESSVDMRAHSRAGPKLGSSCPTQNRPQCFCVTISVFSMYIYYFVGFCGCCLRKMKNMESGG